MPGFGEFLFGSSGGIKKKQIDSLRERLFIANQELIMRDSLYIQSRKKDLEKLKP